MRRHIENLKQRPEHVRHQVALGISAGITGAVALAWLVTNAATGTFALTNPAQPVSEESSGFADTEGNFSELMGAVAAGGEASKQDPELTIVDGNTTSTLTPQPGQNQTDATVIPF